MKSTKYPLFLMLAACLVLSGSASAYARGGGGHGGGHGGGGGHAGFHGGGGAHFHGGAGHVMHGGGHWHGHYRIHSHWRSGYHGWGYYQDPEWMWDDGYDYARPGGHDPNYVPQVWNNGMPGKTVQEYGTIIDASGKAHYGETNCHISPGVNGYTQAPPQGLPSPPYLPSSQQGVPPQYLPLPQQGLPQLYIPAPR